MNCVLEKYNLSCFSEEKQMAFAVDTLTAVNRLNRKVAFLQPVFEAVSNSLEAHATEINIVLQAEDNTLPGMPKKIIGFSIEDNGEGFTQKNRDAFTKLWTTNKLDIGCKGVGRLTWLRVFEKATVKSFVGDEVVSINFDKSFDGHKDIKVEKNTQPATQNKTTISFESVTDKYHKIAKKGENDEDHRAEADLEQIYDVILKHLLVKLSLLKKEKKTFSINLTLDKENCEITDSNIPDLQEEVFEIEDRTQRKHSFRLYYNFFNNDKNQKYLYYCANSRAVQPFKEDISLSSLPNKDSIIMLLSSSYLDERVNDERNEFTLPLSDKNPSALDPLSFPAINAVLKDKVQGIVLTKYPEITKSNDDVKQKAIEKAPYLTDFIKKDTSIIKNEKDLIDNAKKSFEEKKVKSQAGFAKMLEKKSVNPVIFQKAIEEVSAVALAELGEYILYRQNIIAALNNAMADPTKKEDFIHNIFMPMKTDDGQQVDRHYLSNLWLLDDKFMTYSYAASDKTINQIKNAIEEKDKLKYKNKNRPDLIIFFNQDENSTKDVIIAELKGANATNDEKSKALMELPNNIEVIRQNIPETKSIWGYIITSIDSDFQKTIENQGIYQELFSAGDDNKAYYFYNKSLRAHITIVDLKTIVDDSSARNKTFLEILKK